MKQYEDADGDTFDYGLAPGETFEPADFGEIDRSQPHIMTVLGPVEPGALGVTNLQATFVTGQDDPAATLNEIEEAGYVGINALVNLDPLRTARDADEARWLAGRCDLHLIVTTGPPAIGTNDAAAIVRDIEVGIGGSGVYPGAIVTALDSAALSASHAAHLVTGLPLIVRSEPGKRSVDLLDRLRAAGVDPRGVIVADLADEPFTLLSAGCLILLDAGGGGELHHETNATLVRAMIDAGRIDQILLGYDPKSAPAPVFIEQGSRWSWLIEQFPLLLLDAGLSALDARSLMIENPNHALTTHPPAAAGTLEETT